MIALSLSPADDTLALCAEDGTVELWDPHAGTRTGAGPDLPGTVAGLAHAEDGTLIELPVVRGSAGRLVFSPDGTTLYSASPSQGVVAWSGGESWSSFETP
ncbi:hypothetical protein HMPREF3159_10615 [Brachybacterium sp. HMSC06H03]|uniref:hypothetical protein n=1 Tax=Brachybacterium sp. HMSC06H03 TaxID=1581127 RepID=UPI0008A444CC|nr:hypothetical protein [Brachybacterium sp. HMSC06H03]OFT54115.1 hypothetical protein HMPREF3159_10615 [Brachybacterium sp. HMSC06H03]